MPPERCPAVAGGAAVSRRARVLGNIYTALLNRYGPQHWWPARTPFEVCIGAILVQNTNWNNAARALAALDDSGALSFEALSGLDEGQMSALIRPAGFRNIKTRRLGAFLDFLDRRCGGRIENLAATPWPEARRELLAVHGIGPETADSILLYALGQPVFVVDAYTRRMLLAQGFGAYTRDYAAMQALFMDALAPDVALYNEYHALIVALGKERAFSLGRGRDVFYNKNDE